MRATNTTARVTLTVAVAATITLAALFLPSVAAAAPSLSVNVDKTTIYRNEQLSVDIVTSGDYDEISGPSLEGLEVTGRSEGRSFSFGMGASRSERTISLTLAPTRTGSLTIGATRLLQDGKVVASSRPVTITVRDEDAPVSRTRQGRRSGMMSRFPQIAIPQIETVKPPEVEARLSGDGTPVYPGQPLILKYVLVTPMPLDYWSVAVTSKPAMEGLVVREMPRSEESPRQIDRVDGTWYETVIWMATVTPIDVGEINIAPMKLEARFRGFDHFNVVSNPVRIEVVGLPADGAPEGYNPGTVGRFDMEARLEDTEIALGESATLSVRVSGSGNITSIREPVVVADDGVRVDSFANVQGDDEIVVGDEGVSGSRTFKFLLTPDRIPHGRGDDSFVIRVKPLVFFNPESGRWESASADDMFLTVRGSVLTEKAAVRPLPVLGIVETGDLEEPSPRAGTWFTTARFTLLLIVPVFLLAAVETLRAGRGRMNRLGGRAATRKARQRAISELRHLENAPVDDAGFWTSLEMVLRRYVEARFDITTVAMTPTAIASRVVATGTAETATGTLQDLLERCSLARFARQDSTTDRKTVIESARQCLISLDRAGGGTA